MRKSLPLRSSRGRCSNSKYSYRDRWLAVRSDTVRVPNGTILSPYHTIEFPEWVCAIALTPEREIVLIEEYRHGIERPSFELPCGTPDDEGEDVLEAMQRELLEETGYGSEEWHSLGSSTANTARQNNRVHAFLALDAHKVSDQKLDPGEMIRTHVVAWDKFVADLAEGRLEIPGLHLAALWQLSDLRQKDARSAPARARSLGSRFWRKLDTNRHARHRSGGPGAKLPLPFEAHSCVV